MNSSKDKKDSEKKEEEEVVRCHAEEFLRNKQEFDCKHKACDNPQIALTITEKDKNGEIKKFDVCHFCWTKIAKSNVEWSS